MAQSQLIIEDDDAAQVGQRILAFAKEDPVLKTVVSNNTSSLATEVSRQNLVTLGRSVVVGIVGAGGGN